MSVDTKGGNRPIKLRVQGQFEKGIISESQFGKSYMMCYSQADQLTIINNWSLFDTQDAEEGSQQFNLKDSLHGREILCTTAFQAMDQDLIILTGSEDTFLKVSYFTNSTQQLTTLQTFCNHVASIRSISTLQVSPTDFIIVTAGSRMQAHIYKFNTQQLSMSHLCEFMRSFEQDVD